MNRAISPSHTALTLQRLCHQPLTLNPPLPNHFTQHFLSENIIHSRYPSVATDRINKSESGKSIAGIRHMLSKSLFNKEKKRAENQVQKNNLDLLLNRSDSLPISPQTAQRDDKVKNCKMVCQQNQNENMINPRCRQNVRNCAFSVDRECDKRWDGQHYAGSAHKQEVGSADFWKQGVSTRELQDEKFNRLLQEHYVLNGDKSLDIQSKFAMRKNKRDFLEMQMLQPFPGDDRAVIHQKLLQQQNKYMREQLITFTTIIDEQRIKVQQLKYKVKNHRKENSRLREKNQKMQVEMTRLSENARELSVRNDQYWKSMKQLSEQKKELEGKLVRVEKECDMILLKLHSYEQRQKYFENLIEENGKQKQQCCDEIHEKDRQIAELNEAIYILKNKVTALEEACKQTQENKLNLSNQMKEEDEAEIFESKGRNSSICLSLAEAQSLKNIIEQKQLLIKEQREKKLSLINQIKLLQDKLESNVREQDQELEDLLQNCVNELEKERNKNILLIQQIQKLKKGILSLN